MRPIWHILSSFVLGTIIFFLTRSLFAGLIVFLTGVFIDLDHLIDYWVLKPKHPFSVKDFLDCERYDAQKKWVFIFFHGWEWAALAVVVSWFSGWNTLLTAVSLSVVLHILLDTLGTIKGSDLSGSIYFISLRAIKGFKKKRFQDVSQSKGIS